MTSSRRVRVRRGVLGQPDLRRLRLALELSVDEAAKVLHENRVLVYEQEVASRPDPFYLQTSRASYLRYAHLLLGTGVSLTSGLNADGLPVGIGISESIARVLAQYSLDGRTTDELVTTPPEVLAAFVDYGWRKLRRDTRAAPARREAQVRRDREARLAGEPARRKIAELEAAVAVERFLNSAD